MTTPCLSPHVLESLLDDQFPEPRRTAACAHLATCPDCQAAAEAIIAALAAKAVPAGALSAAPLPASDGEELASLLQHLKALRPDDGSDSFAGATVIDTPLVTPGFVDDTEPNVIDSLRESSGKVADAALGTTIGPYTLTAELGHGGFGIVYRAEQQRPIRRTVALKLIKLGMDSREIIARFDAERQALALMDHPHIARILDAGTTGRDEGQGSGSREKEFSPLDTQPSTLDPQPSTLPPAAPTS